MRQWRHVQSGRWRRCVVRMRSRLQRSCLLSYATCKRPICAKRPCVKLSKTCYSRILRFQSVYATAHPVRMAAPVAYLEAELLTAHVLRDTAEPLVQVSAYNYRMLLYFALDISTSCLFCTGLFNFNFINFNSKLSSCLSLDVHACTRETNAAQQSVLVMTFQLYVISFHACAPPSPAACHMPSSCAGTCTDMYLHVHTYTVHVHRERTKKR